MEGVEPDWQRTALEYAKRIHVLECTAVADQESYRKLQEELEQADKSLAKMLTDIGALQVENENLKLRLEMAESNNPDSVLSKHNAMLMACKARDAAQEELERLKLTLAAVRDAFDELPTHWTDEDGRMRGVVRWDDVMAVYVRVKQAASEALR